MLRSATERAFSPGVKSKAWLRRASDVLEIKEARQTITHQTMTIKKNLLRGASNVKPPRCLYSPEEFVDVATPLSALTAQLEATRLDL